MTIRYSKPFSKQYRKLPESIKGKIKKLVRTLLENPHHPGVGVKKMVNSDEIFEARVDIHYRVTFKIEGDCIVMRRVGTHAIYRNP